MPITITPTQSTAAAWQGKTRAPLKLTIHALFLIVPVTLLNLGYAVQKGDDFTDPTHKGLRGRTGLQWKVLIAYLLPALIPTFALLALAPRVIYLYAYRTLTPLFTLTTSTALVSVWVACLLRNVYMLRASAWNKPRYSGSIIDDSTCAVFWAGFAGGIVGILLYLILAAKAGRIMLKNRKGGAIRIEEDGAAEQETGLIK